MRFTLGIDTAGPVGSVAIAVDGRGATAEPLPEGGHSAGLAPAVERLLASRGVGLRDLGCIAVSEGPGSFTGLRIGLAWAKGVAVGASVPIALVSAHDAAAHALREAAPWLATVTQGERGRVLAALWRGGAAASREWGPESIAEEDAVDRIREAAVGVGIVPIHAATERIRDLIEDQGGILLPSPALAPAIAELGDRLLRDGTALADVASAAPVYGRAPNARKPVRP